MPSRKCEYCGVIPNLSTNKCLNCGGLLNQPTTDTLKLSTKKSLLFALLFIMLVISPLAYQQHIENTSDAILKKLQPEGVEPDLKTAAFSHFKIKAKFTQVLVEITPIKILVAEHYYTMGNYPTSLNEIGFNEPSLNTGELIHTIQLSEKGLILIHLTAADFGNNKTLTLTPSLTMGGMNMHWACTSNLEKQFIPDVCHSTV